MMDSENLYEQLSIDGLVLVKATTLLVMELIHKKNIELIVKWFFYPRNIFLSLLEVP